MKKILINFFYWGSKNSGIFRAAYNLIKELSKISEEEVYILTSFPLDISSVNSLLYPKEYSKFLHFLKLQKIFYDVTKKIKPHLIFNPFHVGYFFNKKIPQICVVYDLVHITTFKKRIPSFIYHKVFLKKLIDNCRLIITPSKFTKEELISVFNINRDKIRIAHLAPDPVFKKLNLSKENFYLTLNPSFPYKNVDYIIKMWKILRVQDQLKIIGFREDFKNYINFLKKLVKKLNLEDKIIFYGEVNDETLIQLYNQAKALISASLKEGFNLPPLEALACGTPVILSDIPVHREIYGDIGIFFDLNNEESFLNALNQVEKINYEDFEKKRLEFIKRFSWQKTAEEIYKIIKECIEE